jgi:hypothetical protein
MQWEASRVVWGKLHGNKLRQIAGKQTVLLKASTEGLEREYSCFDGSARALLLSRI